MPHTIEKTVFDFEELSDSAKSRARDWYREGALDYDWWDSIYEDAATCAGILGINLRTRPVKLMGGGTRYDPCIYFSGFWSQGDGACFEGSYSYAKGCAKKIRKHAPKDGGQNDKLHKVADSLVAIQKKHGYRLGASVRQTGHYSHEHSTTIEVWRGDESANVEAETEEALAEALRDFMRWIYRQLEAEYEYLNSDEQVDETIKANGYTFDEDGNREN